MPKILGLLGSHRKMGNSEVMLREALLAAQEMGAECEIVRLTDLDLKPCRGCLACVFKGRCSVDDDLPALLGRIKEADGLIVAAPTYILSPAGVIKMLVDRCLNMVSLSGEPGRGNRPAGLISVAGGEAMNPLGREFLSLVATSYGFQVVDYMEAYAQGPGEVLLDDANPARAGVLGRNVYRAAAGEGDRPAAGDNQCPVCYSRVFRLTDDGRVQCPFCLARGRWEPGKASLVFEPASLDNNFANPAFRLAHMKESIEPSREQFRERRRRVQEKAAKYGRDPAPLDEG